LCSQLPSRHSISGALFVTIIGGVLIGGTIAYLFMLLAGRTPDYLVEITFTTLVAYGSFFVAEHYHCSGVLAALTAGLVVGNFRSSGSISAAGRHALGPFWEYVAFVANSLIFLLIGAQEAQQHFKGLWAPVLVAIVLVTLGRAVAIYPLCALFARSRSTLGPLIGVDGGYLGAGYDGLGRIGNTSGDFRPGLRVQVTRHSNGKENRETHENEDIKRLRLDVMVL